MLWQSAAPGRRSPQRLGVLFRAQICRFDETHIKLGNPLTGGQNCIRHSGTAETGIILDRLNRRDNDRIDAEPRAIRLTRVVCLVWMSGTLQRISSLSAAKLATDARNLAPMAIDQVVKGFVLLRARFLGQSQYSCLH